MKEILDIIFIMLRWSCQWFVYKCRQIDKLIDEFLNKLDDI